MVNPPIGLLKNSHIAAVLVAYLCGVALLRLRVRSCGCNDLTVFEQPGFFNNLLLVHYLIILGTACWNLPGFTQPMGLPGNYTAKAPVQPLSASQ